MIYISKSGHVNRHPTTIISNQCNAQIYVKEVNGLNVIIKTLDLAVIVFETWGEVEVSYILAGSLYSVTFA